jgi:hypothetical protein
MFNKRAPKGVEGEQHHRPLAPPVRGPKLLPAGHTTEALLKRVKWGWDPLTPHLHRRPEIPLLSPTQCTQSTCHYLLGNTMSPPHHAHKCHNLRNTPYPIQKGRLKHTPSPWKIYTDWRFGPYHPWWEFQLHTRCCGLYWPLPLHPRAGGLGAWSRVDTHGREMPHALLCSRSNLD